MRGRSSGRIGKLEAQVTKTSAQAKSEARCFLCDSALRRNRGEPIEGGEGVALCRACGAIYRYPALCC